MKKCMMALVCLLALPLFAEEKTLKESAHHTVVPQDTMWDLAMHYYGTHFKWRRIAEANPAPNVKDPHWIYPGQVLLIPADEPAVEAAEPEPAKEEPPKPPEPAPAPAPAPPPKPVKAAAPPPQPKYDPTRGDGITLPDSLSARMPDGMTGQSPAVYRMVMPAGWTADGEIREMEGGRDSIVFEGQHVHATLYKEARKRQRLSVYRRAAPTEADTDHNAIYVHKVGQVEVVRKLANGVYRVLIVDSGDTIQPGDLLKMED